MVSGHSMTQGVQKPSSHEVIFRSAGGDFSYYILKYGIVRKCEKHRLDIGIVAPHMFHAVFFLVASCELMFLDASFHIVRHPCADYKSVLRAAILSGHRYNNSLCRLAPAIRFPEFTEVLHRFVIYGRIMLVKSGFKIDFGFDDVVKAFRCLPLLCGLPSLFRTSYGRDATSSTNCLGGRTPLNGFLFCHGIKGY